MYDEPPIKVSKNTQKFVYDLSKLEEPVVEKINSVLSNLKEQQSAESQLEKNRGRRYMWQRTPKPYLLCLGYFLFLGTLGGFSYQAYSHIPENYIQLFIILQACVLILPLFVVGFLSYSYVKNKSLQEDDIMEDNKKSLL